MTTAEAAACLAAMDQVLILTHVRPDGDTIGSAAALCCGLRALGKTAYLLPNPELTATYAPYAAPYLAEADFAPAYVVSVDIAALSLLPENARPYQDRIALAIDHHPSQEFFARETCLEADSAACGEIVYDILRQLTPLTPEMALPLYVAISTDTGCFVYSNTTPDTHRIAAALMETGFDAQWVNKRHFRVKSLKRMQIESRLVREMDLAQNGTLVFAYVTLDLIREPEATEEDLEDISAFIGQLEGVDNAVTIRQLKPEECKISLRTDGKTLNASAVCAVYGGGGHAAAAGCTIQGTPAQAKAAMAAAEGDYKAAAKNLEGYNAAIALVQSNDLAGAKKAIAKDNSADADYLRAVIAAKEGDLKTAEAQLKSAVSKNPALAQKAAKDINLKALKK